MLKFALKDKGLRALFLLALVIAVGMPLDSTSTPHPLYRKLIVNNAENDAIRLASHLMTDLLQDKTSLQAHTFGRSATRKLNQIRADFHLYKIKVFAVDGDIVLSTSPEDLGQKNDQGYWNRVESYISLSSDANLSHGICPECAQKYYPGMKLYEKEN